MCIDCSIDSGAFHSSHPWWPIIPRLICRFLRFFFMFGCRDLTLPIPHVWSSWGHTNSRDLEVEVLRCLAKQYVWCFHARVSLLIAARACPTPQSSSASPLRSSHIFRRTGSKTFLRSILVPRPPIQTRAPISRLERRGTSGIVPTCMHTS